MFTANEAAAVQRIREFLAAHFTLLEGFAVAEIPVPGCMTPRDFRDLVEGCLEDFSAIACPDAVAQLRAEMECGVRINGFSLIQWERGVPFGRAEVLAS